MRILYAALLFMMMLVGAPAALAARTAQTRAAAIIMNERSFLCIKPR